MMLFLHWVGISVWLGASITFMLWGPAARRSSLDAWAHTWRVLDQLQRWVVLPAAVVATGTGILLTMRLVTAAPGTGSQLWLVMMQVTGILAFALAVWATNLTGRIARLAGASVEKGERDERAESVRKRLALVGSVSGVLILAALAFASFKP
jgi:hypothetical protein